MNNITFLQNNQFSLIKQLFLKLTDEKRAEFIHFVNSIKEQGVDLLEVFNAQSISRFLQSQKYDNSRPDVCPICHGHYIVKNGTKKGAQRYLCRDCGRSFGDTENSILKSTKKDLGVWELYIQCMIDKMPLTRIAERCGIDVKTAFVWRHKILDALQNMMTRVILNGIVELDETYFRISYKGQKKGSFPGKARRRGKSRFKEGKGQGKKRGISDNLVCVPCGVNLEGKSIAKISNLGHPSIVDLGHVFNNKLEKGSIAVSDSLPGYGKLSEQNGTYHIEIPAGCNSDGIFNIQTVNSYHSSLKRLLNFWFKGVSSKYLNNYIVYHNMVDFSLGSTTLKTNVMKKFTFSTNCSRTYKNISDRPLIPLLG